MPRNSEPPAATPARTIESVYLEHAPQLRRVAVQKFGIPKLDAETLVHDVFAAYVANPGAARANLRAYLIAATCNASGNYRRSKEMCGGGEERDEVRTSVDPSLNVELREDEPSDEGADLAWCKKVRKFADRIDAEDAEAHRLLDGVIDSPYRLARARIAAKKQFRTGGVVRLLCEAIREEYDDKPLYALELAEAAKLIGESLPDGYYPSRLVFDLRGRAWKEYAIVCQELGRYQLAINALDQADNAYRRLPDPWATRAAVSLARGILLWRLRRYPDALPYVQSAAREYELRQDNRRFIEAREVEAVILHRNGDLPRAQAIYEQAFHAADNFEDLEMKARAARNLGVVYRELGDFANANDYFLAALQIYERLNQTARATRTRWSLGRLSLAAGDHEEAEKRLLAAIDSLEESGLVSDVNEALTDLAKCLASQGRDEDSACVNSWLALRQIKRTESDRSPNSREFIISYYLRECFRARTVARASELAERLRANRATVSRTTTQELGRTLVSEMRAGQLQEAARLLRTTTLPIAEVASRSAFGDRATFFRVFRTALRMTPGEYRASSAGQQNATLRR